MYLAVPYSEIAIIFPISPPPRTELYIWKGDFFSSLLLCIPSFCTLLRARAISWDLPNLRLPQFPSAEDFPPTQKPFHHLRLLIAQLGGLVEGPGAVFLGQQLRPTTPGKRCR